jgi:aminoglycoside phosphotransferase family enzyme
MSTTSVHPDQAELVEALASGAAMGEPEPLRRLDTHMSHVFLGAEHVYKLKRAIRHPFADLSTLSRRYAACQAELRLNRRLAPTLYEAVAPVRRAADGQIRLGGPGVTLDYVVVMRRFPDGALLDEIAQAGALTERQILEAVDIIAHFHAGLPAHHEMGHAADYQRTLAGLRDTEAAGAARLGVTTGSDALFARLGEALAQQAPLIETRREAGWVREGHGDLHLRNICLFEGRVTPFDALEFDPALSITDVLYDLAFLLMDLRVRGLVRLAELAEARYWAISGQAPAKVLLQVFMALRATVRMAVATEAGDLTDAALYRHFAEQALAAPSPALNAARALQPDRTVKDFPCPA